MASQGFAQQTTEASAAAMSLTANRSQCHRYTPHADEEGASFTF